MKKFVILIFCLGILSCESGPSIPTRENEENLSIKASDTLEFVLATAIPIEGGYSIVKQPEHSAISEIQYRQEGIVYIYKPEEGFTGKDLVTIKRADSNGAEIISETITTINIKVKN